MNKNIYIAVGVVALVGALFFFLPGQRVGAPIMNIPGLLANASTTVSTSVVASFTIPSGTQMWTISNTGTNDAYISATSTKLTAFAGLLVRASSTMSFYGDSLWTGTVYTVGQAATVLSVLRF